MIAGREEEWELLLRRLELALDGRLGRRVRELRIRWADDGLVLHGQAPNFHTKQLAQHGLMALTPLPLRANHIQVL